jgi:AmmeMemoRadiSam system protein B
MESNSRPALRAVESIVVPDRQHGRVLLLRDTQGVTDAHAVIPPALIPIVVRFTGRLTCHEIAVAVSQELGAEVPADVVVRLADELERRLFLDGPTFREARARVEMEFGKAAVRAAAHAGGAYHGDRHALAQYIEESCLAKAAPLDFEPSPSSGGRMLGLIAPHIDPWRGAVGYGYAYRALQTALPADAETFILFGTSHAPMRQPFALCRKAFATPLGTVDADLAGIDALARAAQGFDPYADQMNHKREHSIEFQAVFLKHLLGRRPARIIPVLAGLGAQQASGDDPAGDARVARFIDAVRGLVAEGAGKVVVVAGADLAHVGPRFGDGSPLDEGQRTMLEDIDRTSLDRAASVDPRSFWDHVSADLDTRRVCGLAPIWSLLSSLGQGARGRVLHYEQTIDRDDGSIVSHAAMGFYD